MNLERGGKMIKKIIISSLTIGVLLGVPMAQGLVLPHKIMYNERILAKGVRNVNNCISNYRYFKYSALPSIEQSFYYRRVFIFIHRLSKEYPHFKEWYRKLFTADKKLNLDR